MTSQEQPLQEPTTEPTIPQTTSSMPYDSPLSGGYIPGSVKGSKKLTELTELCTKLFDKVTSLEQDLKQTKQVYSKALTKLVKKVKHLEDQLKSTTERRKGKMVISDEEEDLVLEDPSKQGRMSETEYEEVETEHAKVEYGDILQQITPSKVQQGEEQSQESFEVYLDVLSAAKILADASREKTFKSYTRRRSTDSLRVSTVGDIFSTTEEILSTNEEIAQKLNEEEMAKVAAREEHERIDFEKAIDSRKTIRCYKKVSNTQEETSLSSSSKEEYDDLLEEYGWIQMNSFKGISYDEIRPIFEEEYRKVQTLFKKDTEVEKTKRVLEETLLQESFKKLRTAEASSSEPIQEQPTEEPKELSEEELKKMLEIVLIEETKAEALQVKYPIIDWEVHTEGS
ncbi:hypothetical protein Tco_0874872 [Tanacetum coccineum]|uniref:Uncharacterized protein n=1 Tax=Tanacetum coccineum TaxID=301880 RepID=A0ABQ5BN78_9ASTR